MNDSTTCRIATIPTAQSSSEYVPAPNTLANVGTPTISVPGVVTCCEWVTISATPSRKNNIASVATNDGIPTHATNSPLTAPNPAAITSDRIMLGISGIPAPLSFQNAIG